MRTSQKIVQCTLLAAALGLCTLALAADPVQVDIGPGTQVVQPGWTAWSIGPGGAYNGAGPFELSLPSTFAGNLTLILSGPSGVGVREGTAGTGPLGGLIKDAVKQNATFSLTFSGLNAGAYDLTTWHNDARLGYEGWFDIYVTDVNRTEELVYTAVETSYVADSQNVTTRNYVIVADGSSDVVLTMTPIPSPNKPTPEAWLCGFLLQAPVLKITKQPTSTVVDLGGTGTFTVEASLGGSTAGLTYRWQKGGVDIGGATGASYTTPTVVAGDNGTKYHVIVRATDGQNLTSDECNLRIMDPMGKTLPVVTSGGLLVRLTSDAGVISDASGVSSWLDQSPNGYEFTPVNANMPLLETGLTGNKVVRFKGNALLKSTVPIQLFPDVDSGLTIFTAFSTVNNAGQKFVVNWGIKDELNNRGNVELGYNTGTGGGAGNFGLHRGCGLATTTPDNLIMNNEFVILSTLAKSSGAPPDNVEIYKNGTPPPLVARGTLGTGCFPDHVGWIAPGEYSTGLATLDIGARDDSAAGGGFGAYHNGDIGEILVYQGTLSASDRTAVENYLGARYGVTTTPLLVIWKQPATTVVALGGTATFTVEANLAGSTVGLTYQWQKGGVNIGGATSASYTTPPAVAGDNGTKYKVIVRAPDGQIVTSAEANMRIIGPVGQTPPEVVSGTLLVRLTADAGLTSDASGVSLWQDQSANGYEFAPINANLPLLETGLSGNKVLRFNGNAMLKSSLPMQLFPDADSGLTLFAAFSAVNNSGQQFVLNWGIKDGNTRGNVELGYDTGMGAGVGNFGLHYGCGLATLAPENTIVNNEFAILSTLVKSSGAPPDNVAIFKNGIPLPLVRNGGAGSGCFPDHATGGWLAPGEYQIGLAPLDIGARDDGGAGSFGNFMSGDIGEILVYQGTLSQTDREAVEKYLGERYAVATGVPPIKMEIGHCVRLRYPLSAFNYILEESNTAGGPWTVVTNTRVVVGLEYQVVIDGIGNTYYQLRKP